MSAKAFWIGPSIEPRNVSGKGIRLMSSAMPSSGLW
jgi:hypothetical protein